MMEGTFVPLSHHHAVEFHMTKSIKSPHKLYLIDAHKAQGILRNAIHVCRVSLLYLRLEHTPSHFGGMGLHRRR